MYLDNGTCGSRRISHGYLFTYATVLCPSVDGRNCAGGRHGRCHSPDLAGLSVPDLRITVSSEEEELALCNYPVFIGEEKASSMTHQFSGSGSMELGLGPFCADVHCHHVHSVILG